ncbi:MAG: sensor histidine kinase [Kineosporiaceae bacterium]
MTAAVLAVVVVTWVVAPPLFDEHLRRAGETDPHVLAHAREAFATSLLIGVASALAVSALAAAGVALVTSRRLASPFSELARAADRIARGRFDVAVPDPRLGTEARDLAGSFREMARRLAEADTERRRQQNDLAHELRSPLSTLLAQVEALQDGVLDPDAGTLAALRSQLDRMSRLVTDLQVLAAAEERTLALDPVPVDLAAEAERAVAAARPMATRAGVRLGVTAPGPVSALADPARLAQIVGNLLDNALRHTPDGGVVTVAVSPDGEDGLLSVADTGEGFAPEHLPHVFDRLYRGDPSRHHHDGDGSGLGLTISRALARRMSGDLQASNREDGPGARLVLRLPAPGAAGAQDDRQLPSQVTRSHR